MANFRKNYKFIFPQKCVELINSIYDSNHLYQNCPRRVAKGFQVIYLYFKALPQDLLQAVYILFIERNENNSALGKK